jgi:hypothetical protein
MADISSQLIAHDFTGVQEGNWFYVWHNAYQTNRPGELYFADGTTASSPYPSGGLTRKVNTLIVIPDDIIIIGAGLIQTMAGYGAGSGGDNIGATANIADSYHGSNTLFQKWNQFGNTTTVVGTPVQGAWPSLSGLYKISLLPNGFGINPIPKIIGYHYFNAKKLDKTIYLYVLLEGETIGMVFKMLFPGCLISYLFFYKDTNNTIKISCKAANNYADAIDQTILGIKIAIKQIAIVDVTIKTTNFVSNVIPDATFKDPLMDLQCNPTVVGKNVAGQIRSSTIDGNAGVNLQSWSLTSNGTHGSRTLTGVEKFRITKSGSSATLQTVGTTQTTVDAIGNSIQQFIPEGTVIPVSTTNPSQASINNSKVWIELYTEFPPSYPPVPSNDYDDSHTIPAGSDVKLIAKTTRTSNTPFSAEWTFTSVLRAISSSQKTSTDGIIGGELDFTTVLTNQIATTYTLNLYDTKNSLIGKDSITLVVNN